MFKNILVITSLLFFGCASKDSLRTSSTTEKLCSDKPVKEVYGYLVKNMKEHYLGSSNVDSHTDKGTHDGSIMSGLTGTTFIENKRVSNDKYEIILSIKAGITHRMYGEILDIHKGTGSCKTEIELHYMNSVWKNVHGSYIKKILK